MDEIIPNLWAWRCHHGPGRVGWGKWAASMGSWVGVARAGGVLPSTSERFPEGMQNTLKISVADPNQLFFPAPSLSDTVPHSHIQATTFN